MKKHLYSVKWDIKRGKRDRPREMYVEASTAKEARSVFDEYYTSWRDPDYGFFGQPHAFHIEVHRISEIPNGSQTMKIYARD